MFHPWVFDRWLISTWPFSNRGSIPISLDWKLERWSIVGNINIISVSDAVLQYLSIENGTLVNRWKAQARCGRRQTLGQTQYNTLQTAISTNSDGNFQLYDCIIQKYNYHREVIGIAQVKSKKTVAVMLDLKDRFRRLQKNSCCSKIDRMNTLSFICFIPHICHFFYTGKIFGE